MAFFKSELIVHLNELLSSLALEYLPHVRQKVNDAPPPPDECSFYYTSHDETLLADYIAGEREYRIEFHVHKALIKEGFFTCISAQPGNGGNLCLRVSRCLAGRPLPVDLPVKDDDFGVWATLFVARQVFTHKDPERTDTVEWIHTFCSEEDMDGFSVLKIPKDLKTPELPSRREPLFQWMWRHDPAVYASIVSCGYITKEMEEAFVSEQNAAEQEHGRDCLFKWVCCLVPSLLGIKRSEPVARQFQSKN